MRNLESILKDKKVPDDDWAFVLRKCLSGEPLGVIKTVSDNLLNDYVHLKRLLEQHFQLTEMGQREKFKKIPKANQTFLDFVSEVKLTLENWTKAANVQAFEDLKDLIVKDKILSSVPHRLYTFLVEQGVTSLDHVILKGTAFYDANKDIFASGLTSEQNIGAPVMYQDKQRFGKTKTKKVGFMTGKKRAPWWGNFSMCKFCHINHG